RQFSGTIDVDEQNPLNSTVNLTIDAGSLDSGAVQGREDLIKGADMLEVEKYPTITFKSTGIKQQDVNHYTVTGDLTLRGVTKQVQIPWEFGGRAARGMGVRAGFSGNLTVNKSDFSVPFDREFEPGRAVVADEIKIELQIEAAPAA